MSAYKLDPSRLRLVAEMLTAATNPSHDAAEQIAAGVCLEAEAEIVRLRAEVEKLRGLLKRVSVRRRLNLGLVRDIEEALRG